MIWLVCCAVDAQRPVGATVNSEMLFGGVLKVFGIVSGRLANLPLHKHNPAPTYNKLPVSKLLKWIWSRVCVKCAAKSWHINLYWAQPYIPPHLHGPPSRRKMKSLVHARNLISRMCACLHAFKLRPDHTFQNNNPSPRVCVCVIFIRHISSRFCPCCLCLQRIELSNRFISKFARLDCAR